MTFLLPLLAALPCHAGGFSVVGSLVRENAVDVGGHVEGTILVRNDSDERQQIVVYQRDYRFAADGANDYVDPGTHERSNSAWIKLTPSQLTLEPDETERIHYRLDVPLDPDLAGTYWSLIMVEPAVVAPLEPPPPGRSVSIRTVVRYAVQVVTHVGEGGEGHLSFDRGELVDEAEETRLSVDIRNVGARLVAPRVWVELYDGDGRSAGRFDARGRPGLLPGCSARYSVDLAKVPPGAYTALAVADGGVGGVFGTEYTVELR
ncbi:MAG: hypothetical protein ACK4YP_08925 [Myxococcota bacterium]